MYLQSIITLNIKDLIKPTIAAFNNVMTGSNPENFKKKYGVRHFRLQLFSLDSLNFYCIL